MQVPQISIFHGVRLFSAAVLCVAVLGGCGSSASRPETSATRVVPREQVQNREAQAAQELATARSAAKARSNSLATPKPAAATVKKTEGPILPNGPAVWLYVSLTSQAYFMKEGLDGSVRSMVWENFLRKYKIPYIRVTAPDVLDKVPAHSVLLLPSSAALSAVEVASIQGARARGVSVLSTWLTGVRNEAGEWRGFDTMEKVLGVRVAGTTEDAQDDNFMMVAGDSPVLHALPAGNRVWLDRVKEYWPLRLVGAHTAAHMMTWGREYVSEKPTGVIAYDEQKQASGVYSRNVVLGYPEQLWLTAEPKHLEAIAHNVLAWLFRQPDAYLAGWPYPHHSGFVMAVEAAEDVAEIDLDFSKRLESVGVKATYFLLSESMKRAAPVAKKIQSRGHELGYFGDKFVGYKDQNAQTQAQRLDAMVAGMQEAGIKLGAQAGFTAPMDSYDDTTLKLLQERRVGYYAAFMDSTDTGMPFFPKGTTDVNSATVVLPRTQRGPEEAIEEGDPDEGIQHFLDQLALSESMGLLSFIRIPSQTILAQEHQDLILNHLKERKGKAWMTTASDIAQWWRERAKISTRLEFEGERPMLVVTIYGSEALKNPSSVWVNLPRKGARLRLQSSQVDNPTPPVAPVDDWRDAVLLEDLDPGEYCWYLQFDSTAETRK